MKKIKDNIKLFKLLIRDDLSIYKDLLLQFEKYWLFKEIYLKENDASIKSAKKDKNNIIFIFTFSSKKKAKSFIKSNKGNIVEFNNKKYLICISTETESKHEDKKEVEVYFKEGE